MTYKRSSSTWLRLAVVCMIGSLELLTSIGCGGSKTSQGITRTGNLRVQIEWPERTTSRLIPVAAESIRIELKSVAGFTVSQLLVRPLSSLTISNLPPGEFSLTARAYPTADPGVSTAQASVLQSVAVIEGTTVECPLTLNSTVDHVVLTNAPSQMTKGMKALAVVNAYDVLNRLVLTNPSTWNCESSDTAIVTLEQDESTWSIRGMLRGTARITVTENESGKSTSTGITVVSPPPTLSMTAPATLLLYGESGTIMWDSTDATRVVSSTFDAVMVAGSVSVTPTKTTDYTLMVSNEIGETIEKSVTVKVAVVSVNLLPANAVTDIGGSFPFTSYVDGAVNKSVTWSVVEAAGGSITQDGSYTAPRVAGTYHVKATSKANSLIAATIAIRVRAAGGNVIIN